ncbi:hypothetical protein CL622_02575 [archaeon]|nr:hypothetical protein [archaeon]|tara:strand:+ start:149 stop:382 length:234 start_codon:yes stop_codon:yes gene_type:complete
MGKLMDNLDNYLEFGVLVGYGLAEPTIDRMKKYVDGVWTGIRHPIAMYIMHKEINSLRYLDQFEMMDVEIKREIGKY